MSQLKKLFSESAVYGLSSVVSKFINILLIPIYTNGIFSESDYGIQSLVNNTFILLSILSVLSLDNSIARWFFDTEDIKEKKTSINTYIWSCIGMAAIFSVITLLANKFIANNILNASNTSYLLFIASINLPMSMCVSITTNVLRLEQRPKATAIFSLTYSLVLIGLNILFVIVLKYHLNGIFYAQLITSIITTIASFILLQKWIRFPSINVPRWKEMFAFSAPMIPGTIAFWVVNLSGAYFLQHLLDNNTVEVGLFQIGIQAAAGIALVTSAFQMAWGPFAYNLHLKNPKLGIETFSHVLSAFSLGIGLFAFVYVIFLPELLQILTAPKFYGAIWVAALMVLNPILIALSYIASIGTGIAKNNKAFGISMIISAILLIILNFIFIPILGKEGAAISILLSQCICPISIFWHAQKLYPIPYKFKKSFFTLFSLYGIGLFTLFLFSFFTITSLIFIILIKLSVFLIISFIFIQLVGLDIYKSLKTIN